MKARVPSEATRTGRAMLKAFGDALLAECSRSDDPKLKSFHDLIAGLK